MDFYKNKVHLSIEMTHLHNIVLGLSLVIAAPVMAQETPIFAPLRLVEQGQRDFLTARQDLSEQMIQLSAADEAEAGKTLNANLLLDMAELHLAWMLRREAGGYLAALDPESLTPAAQRRYRTLDLALALLDQQNSAGGLGQAVSRSVGWGQGQALRAAAFARLGATDEAARLLPDIIASLKALSPAIEAALLPDLLEAALAAEDWEAGRALAERFASHAALRDGPAYRYLLARASELSGDYLMAFDGYAEAAQGRDVYAHRARLALVRMGRETDSLPLADAVALLKSARWLWSGDDAAREGVMLLASLAEEAGDLEAALWALGHLLRDASDNEAEALRARAQAVYGSFYSAGAAGEIDLSAFLEGHARIAHRWRFDAGFAAHAMAVPQRLLDTGMTALAAREFRALRELAEAGGRSGVAAADPDLIADLRTKEARALLAGGQADAAVDLLSGFANAQGINAEAEALLIDALAQAGRSDELATLRVKAQDMGLRRSRAVALYETGKWVAARLAFLEMWQTHPDQFSFADATRLTLAAYETGDRETVARAASAFPTLTELPGWTEIAATLGGEAETGPPGQEMMRLSMRSADRILDAVTNVTDVKESE
ncbi:hypothetical protein [Sulfitobacter maritimus]|uniref:hypothetical protein n=1 Tax=Sulfitobacter maritimus TaxID=2741719 RepID=UPI001583AF52|nr:hypothetical protein [Sulfitobacter maritimus]